MIQSTCRGLMREFGYEPESKQGSQLRAAMAYLSLPTALVRAGVANRKRMGKAGAYVARRARFGLERAG